jgi:phosphoribosylglycinamide formyltransferase 1
MSRSVPLPIAVLGSGRGSNFAALLEAADQGRLHARFTVVGSDKADAPILSLARSRHIPTYQTTPSTYKTRLEPEIESALADHLKQSGAALVVLAGYMRVVKSPLLDAFPGRIINIHPSLLPAFKGLAAWSQALQAGVSETGCSVHWVDASLDGGPVLAQERVPILAGDTPESLHARIQQAEHRLLPHIVQELALGRIPLPGP